MKTTLALLCLLLLPLLVGCGDDFVGVSKGPDERIFFNRYDPLTQATSIHSIASDGSDDRTILEGAALLAPPAAGTMACQALADSIDLFRVFTANITGSGMRTIRQDSGPVIAIPRITSVALAPGGKTLAYIDNVTPSCIFDLTGTRPAHPLDVPQWQRADFSADGKLLVHVSRNGIDIVDVATGGIVTRIPFSSTIYPSQPVWSPDGRRILYIGSDERDRSSTTIMSVDSASGGSQQLHAGKNILYAAWSRDGAKIAFVLPDAIWMMNADGSGARALTAGGQSFSTFNAIPIQWMADGRRILFTRSVNREGQVGTIDVATQAVTVVARDASDGCVAR